MSRGREVASGAPVEVLWSNAVLPLAQALGLENVFEGRVVETRGDASTLATAGGLRLALPVAPTRGERVCVGVRAEDVLLAADAPGRVSARNVIPARVSRCEPRGADAYVHLETDAGGERLVAKITVGAAAKLALRPGSNVHALVKAQAIRRLA